MFSLILIYFIFVKDDLKENISYKSSQTDGNKNLIFGRCIISQTHLIYINNLFNF